MTQVHRDFVGLYEYLSRKARGRAVKEKTLNRVGFAKGKQNKAKGAAVNRDPAVIAERRAFGLPDKPIRRTVLENQLRFSKIGKKRKVTMPNYSFMETDKEPTEREQAEQRALDAVASSVQAISMALDELTHIPEPKGHKSKLNQRVLIDAVSSLCRATKLDIPRFGLGVVKERVVLPKDRICINCGGPGRTLIDNEWYCGECQ